LDAPMRPVVCAWKMRAPPRRCARMMRPAHELDKSQAHNTVRHTHVQIPRSAATTFVHAAADEHPSVRPSAGPSARPLPPLPCALRALSRLGPTARAPAPEPPLPPPPPHRNLPRLLRPTFTLPHARTLPANPPNNTTAHEPTASGHVPISPAALLSFSRKNPCPGRPFGPITSNSR
jgi:hypothetical protein